jgi:hypothetical protein
VLNLLQVTTLLKSNGINAAASILKVKKADIYNFLKSNGLVYQDGEVKTILDNKEMLVTKVIQKDKQSNNKPPQRVIQSLNKDIDINKISELIDMIEPLKEVIQEYNKNKNIIDIKTPELNPPSVTEVKQKLFKIDVDVLKKWEQFVAEHKQFKVQNLISFALAEFVEKYGK